VSTPTIAPRARAGAISAASMNGAWYSIAVARPSTTRPATKTQYSGAAACTLRPTKPQAMPHLIFF
jgi:hypothetical protein